MRNLSATLSLLWVLSLFGKAAQAQHREDFWLPADSTSGAVTGVIEWPTGIEHSWSGHVLLLVPPAGPYDRDGFQAPALQVQRKYDAPFSALSAALRKEGVAVVRFEHPAARTPSQNCRESLKRGDINEYTLRTKCIDYRAIERLTVTQYRSFLAKILFHVQRRLPAARAKIGMFGFSEGLIHAAAVADKARISISALISVGSPAERLSETANWQTIDRILEMLPLFDQNADGIVTNEEIQNGYARGLGNIMVLYLWLSPDGHWDSNNVSKLRSRLEEKYTQIVEEFRNTDEPGRLYWQSISDNMDAPYVTDSFWRNFFFSAISTAEIMERRKLHGLYLWGGTDSQVSIARQIACIEAANAHGARIQFQSFPERSHLLSRDQQEVWFEPEFATVIALRVKRFLDKIFPTRQPIRPNNLPQSSNQSRQHLP